MERKLQYICGAGDYDYMITDGTTTLYLDGCVIFETVFPVEEFDEIADNCRENGGIGVDEFEGYKIVDTPTNVDYWSPLFETDEELEAADC